MKKASIAHVPREESTMEKDQGTPLSAITAQGVDKYFIDGFNKTTEQFSVAFSLAVLDACAAYKTGRQPEQHRSGHNRLTAVETAIDELDHLIEKKQRNDPNKPVTREALIDKMAETCDLVKTGYVSLPFFNKPVASLTAKIKSDKAPLYDYIDAELRKRLGKSFQEVTTEIKKAQHSNPDDLAMENLGLNPNQGKQPPHP